jgi:hypothetical protein
MLVKRMLFIAWCVACIGSASGCSGFGEEAPLSDGLYLNYDCGGSTIRVTFSEIDAVIFSATLSSGVEEDSGPESVPAQTGGIVNRKLKTDRGTVYEAGIPGPLWIPPSAVKKGGNAHGDEVIEVREWEGWDAGVVKADFG